jgi:hypothetical protein
MDVRRNFRYWDFILCYEDFIFLRKILPILLQQNLHFIVHHAIVPRGFPISVFES